MMICIESLTDVAPVKYSSSSDTDWTNLALIIGIIILIWTIGKIFSYFSKRREGRLKNIKALENKLNEDRWQLNLDREAVRQLAKEKAIGFPWLAKAYADYYELQDLKNADYLRIKSHPALKAAEVVKRLASEKRVTEQLYRVLRYQLEYYEKLFPWLIDFKSEDIDDLIIKLTNKKEGGTDIPDEQDDPVKQWVTQAEYESLSSSEKNQRALDRYWKKKKTRWEIGRDYERFIGYKYEQSGCSVYYQGIIEGFEDLGRDLITTKGNSTEIVQCKCWSQEKTIYEKHIFQLYGTTVEYMLKKMDVKEKMHPSLMPDLMNMNKIKASLYTSTKVSEKAKRFADLLQITVIEKYPLSKYPSIKCNVSRRTNEKIYHLPFDQLYDKTIIEEERNERYVETVKEAEDLGFRRAWRWKGTQHADKANNKV